METPAHDFKAQARALIKTLSLAVPASASQALNSPLAVAAVEAALREAYAKGQATRRAPGAAAAATSSASRASASPSAGSHSHAAAAASGTAPECAHEWEEAFLEGRALGFRCLDCGVFQRDVQARCDHYFVDTGAGEVCVACRKPKRAKSG